MAVKVMGYRFIYRPFAQEHYLSEVVVDVVSRLVHVLETNPANAALSVFLRDKASDIALEVLKKLCKDHKVAYYTHLTAQRVVQSVWRKLVKSNENTNVDPGSNDEGLMAEFTSVIVAKIEKLFRPRSLPIERVDIITILSRASQNQHHADSTKLVIHSDTLTCVIVLVLHFIFSEEDNDVESLHTWPIADEVVDILAMSGARVTKRHHKENFHIELKEIIEMVHSIYAQLLDGSGTKVILQYALSARAKMASRDFASFVAEAILKAHQKSSDNRGSASEKKLPCLNQNNVFRDLVPRFIIQLFPVSFVDKNSLLKCLQLAEQLCALLQQGVGEQEKDANFLFGLEELQVSSASVIQEIAGDCYSSYMQASPLRDDREIDSFLTDEEHCINTSGIIIKSLTSYFKAPLIPSENENIKDTEATPSEEEKEKNEPIQRKNGVST